METQLTIYHMVETSWFLPKAIVATGHDQRAVSVEMNLKRRHINTLRLHPSTAKTFLKS